MLEIKEYSALMTRLNDSQNSELKSKLSITPNGHDLAFHLKRIDDYVKYIDNHSQITAGLMELDYSVSLREAKRLMDKQGWK